MISIQLLSVEQSAVDSSAVSVFSLSLAEAHSWAAIETNNQISAGSNWRTELLLFHTKAGIAEKELLRSESALRSLILACGYAPPSAFATLDTVEFSLHLADQQSCDPSPPGSGARSYSVSDNMFGVCWVWDPSRRLTRGLMYGCEGEGTRQMQDVLNFLATCHKL